MGELNEWGEPYPTLSEMSDPELYKDTLRYHANELSRQVAPIWDGLVINPVLWLSLHIILLIMPVIEVLTKWTEDES